ncbi:MAG: DNA topoisomerase, partial [Candidatus Bathyarchaeia archaeon]
TVEVYVSVDGHRFLLRGSCILKEGWIAFYKPYVQADEVILPSLVEGEEVKIKDIAQEEKFTKPPPRYNPSSLLKKMENEGIGTKTTRADIIETLYNRMYVKEERMVVSDLGFDVVGILSSYCPEVLSADFTKELEYKMEEIQHGKEKMENVLNDALNHLKPLLDELKTHEKSIGQALSEAVRKARLQGRVFGNCPICVTGELLILHSKRTGKRFIGCTNFFKRTCKASFPLPQNGAVKPSGKRCQICSWPMIQFKLKGKRSWVFCINPNCASKEGKSK